MTPDRRKFLEIQAKAGEQWAKDELAATSAPPPKETPAESGILDLGKVNFDLGLTTSEMKFDTGEGEVKTIKIQTDPSQRPILRAGDWYQAQGFFRFNCAPRHPTLTRRQEEFFEWERCAYRPLEDDTVKSWVRDFLQRAIVAKKEGNEFKHVAFRPENKDVGELWNALVQNCHSPNTGPQPPFWCVEPNDDLPPPHECIALQNAILHAPTGETLDPTPGFWTRNALDFDYVANARCPLWEKTLRDYWPNKPDGSVADEIVLLQEIFGYLLLPWTDLQKLFVFVGSGRNGKGVIMKILTLLLGERNVGHPTMSSLANPAFGKEPLIGKLLALVTEMGFGKNDDRIGATNFLKAVSGEDAVEIGRKYRDAWSGTLAVRFVMSGNKVPNFVDDSPALGERIVALKFTRKFEEHERDYKLSDKLALELPGILNWALIGYKRLRESNRFTLPKASEELTGDIKRAASGVQPFIEDACELDPKEHVTEVALHAAYKTWCESIGARPTTKGDFVEAMAVASHIKKHRERKQDKDGTWHTGPRAFLGLKLKPSKLDQVKGGF